MSCAEISELIPLFPDDLEAGESERVSAHVTGCTPCAALLGDYLADAAARRAYAAGRRLPPGHLDGLADAAIREGKKSNVIDLRARLRLASAALVGAAAAAALVLGWLRLTTVETKPEGPIAKHEERDPLRGVSSPVAPATPDRATPPVRPTPGTLVNNGGATAPGGRVPARRAREALERLFLGGDDVQVMPAAGGGAVRRVPYADEATIPIVPGTEYRDAEVEPAPNGTTPRVVRF